VQIGGNVERQPLERFLLDRWLLGSWLLSSLAAHKRIQRARIWLRLVARVRIEVDGLPTHAARYINSATKARISSAPGPVASVSRTV